jgi:hypothetical protein
MIRRSAVVAAAALAALAPSTAVAHQGNPNFRSIVRSVTPATPGLKLEVLNFEDRFEMTNRSARPVTVYGYNKEPYAQIKPNGTVEVNTRSPAYYLNQDRTDTNVTVPASANPKAAPQWKVVDKTGRFQWHDHRMHWMGTGLPPAVKDKSKRTKVFDYRIPIAVGAQKGTIAGTLVYQPEDSKAPIAAFVGFGAIALLGIGVVFIVRRRRRVATPAGEAW